ncbi:phosphatidylserine synthase (CDP-diacylglycerol-serine O-phosphatidyltransferase) [Aliivibrio fischeri ES114]|uniref:Phosphatidylserine synthase (CDP-diacylglycerol-serine O-phosphatidyltransferase) n=1 Tax=Aliivibrio fischeri (strain ATCC 700601 / ES114) TaxID=312309 RepID=Q5E223_ALIF1|nr:CDP-diacylglycerol--serine O-phosphatidyltransferase [Aliivibrio fischeri]AAW86923.1 phosphatidylserine synthase (CDP-diacylglycerol-serine O-phosphatidyltransferase) [Aliivibrio fischeri ES114]KLU77149.1 phosphatidylserine synthase [Aliivibrio fischeri]MUH98680.1 CDP-diacylglycerol--serine O-phosphatidyltransferase [Aliivibrio fischeri]MUI65592.1 CDP-diacylglycerol--serine O-phosphatidyltransferase [Aliivibrio fischeri]OCH31336.1 phosphatidylserine synthase [Aliivibrio fischeri]
MNLKPQESKEQLSKLPMLSQNPENIKILHTAADFRYELLKQIENAQQRIYIVALYLENDDAGREIFTALYEAKQKNPTLDINVLVDWHRAQRGLIGAEKSDGNAALYREFSEKYEHSINVLGVPVRNKEVFGVLHLKGFIFDDTVVYSGASLNDVYLAHKDKYRFDRYHVLNNALLANSMVSFIKKTLIASPAVNCLSQQNRPDTKSLKPEIKELRKQLGLANYQFTSQTRKEGEVGITPLVGLGRKGNKLNNYIRTLLASATSEITICTPYFNFPKPIAKELKKALRRGVKVTIIVGDKTANDFYISPEEEFKTIAGLPYLYEINLRNFAKANETYIASRQLSLNLWKHENNSFHLKGMWVDKEYTLITGSNLNPRAWKLDLENGLLLQDPEQLLVDTKQAELDVILEHTQLIGSYKQVDKLDSYPVEVKKLIKRIKRIKADHILNQIL